jgi:hypothetical protein
MSTGRAKLWPEALALALLVLLGTVGFLAARREAGGEAFVPPLDDVYIHLAIARCFAESGTWGIEPGLFRSASSSPGWTGLVALAHRAGADPHAASLLLAALAAAGVLFAAGAGLRRGSDSPSNRLRFLLLALLVVAAPLPGLAQLGMEHALQTLLSILFGALVVRIVDEEPSLPVASAAVATGAFLTIVRYESFLVVAAGALAVALFRHRFGLALLLVIAASLPPALFGLWSLAQGGPFIPNPIAMKAFRPSLESPREVLRLLGGRIARHLIREPALATLSAANAWILLRRREHSGERALALTALLSTLLHAQLAAVGWLFRYEAAAVALSLFAAAPVARLLAESSLSRSRRALLASLLLLPLLIRAGRAAVDLPRASGDRWRQHVTVARFLDRFAGREKVVLNDVGAAAWLSRVRILDLVGLVSDEPRRFRGEPDGYGADDVERWIAREGAEIAILETGWDYVAERIPASWIPVERWRLPRNVVFGDLDIGFLATNEGAARRLALDLDLFAPSVPADIGRRRIAR